MDVLPLPEPGHQGYLVREGRRALVVDAPLDSDGVTEFLPAWLEAVTVVETGVPGWRAAGGRPLADATGVPLYAPAGRVRGARPLRRGSRLPDFPEAGIIGAPGRRGGEIAVAIGDLLFVGDLDSDAEAEEPATIAATRADLAARFSDRPAHGSAGIRPAGDLATLPEPPPFVGLNAEAVTMTNEGRADLYWADPRFRAPAPPVDRSYVESRRGSPWAPTVLDLRTEPVPQSGATRVTPARLASEIGSLEASREVVVVADRPAIAEAAAGFLRRLGVNAAWVR